jgi:hypothetical protein
MAICISEEASKLIVCMTIEASSQQGDNLKLPLRLMSALNKSV